MPGIAACFRLVFAAAVLACSNLGCAQHRLPAIDPTGEHIFRGSTTLASHDLFHGLFHHRQPDAVAPAVPVAPVAPIAVAPPPVQPPCQPPIEAVPINPIPIVAAPQAPLPVIPVSCGPQPLSQIALPDRPTVAGPIRDHPPYRGPDLTVTPSRIVAPVNTEVIMAAGICSPDGYYVMRQPLEWMLAQDGVGQIVAVGHESRNDSSLLLRASPQKIATNYARAHTSTISQYLNRGTPSPTDDVYLQKGQSWISITSPTEGTTSVVVWTPKEQNWERRKATATIHWVDAAWRFPTSLSARAGQPQPLTTTLTRAAGDPIAGWIIRYEVLDGPPANFGRVGTTIEIPTDVAGRATANLIPGSLEPGITTVRVQIIRPATRAGDSQMVVGQSTFGVQWTTPGLSVRALGSTATLSDGAIGYRVEVTNGGDLTTHNVALSFTPPAGVTVLNSNPIPQTFGQRLEWRIGDLPPGTTSIVEVNCRAALAGSIRSSFIASSTEVSRAEGIATTEVRTNALIVKMVGDEAVQVGREARFSIDITNNGPTPLTNVTVSDTFDPGLAHAGGERSPVVRQIPIIQPGQTERLAIAFNVIQPGRHFHRLDVTADGGHVASARAGVTGTASVATPPQLSARVTGPQNRGTGEVASFNVEMKNNGSAPATNVLLTVTWGTSLELTEASRGHEDNIAQFTTRWRIPQLSPGETQTRQLNFFCRTPDDQGAMVRATVASDQTGPVASQTATIIVPGGAAAPRSAPVSPPTAASGLRVTASPTSNPIAAGGVTTLIMNLTNERATADQNVALSVQALDSGVSLRVAGATPTQVASASATAIDFAPIRELRLGETQQYRIEVRGATPGQHRIRATATSGAIPAGTSSEAEIAVNP